MRRRRPGLTVRATQYSHITSAGSNAILISMAICAAGSLGLTLGLLLASVRL